MNKRGVIYKITCKITNKVYIGQTIRPMNERFERHLKEAEKTPNTKNHFHRAIRKYGRDNFTIEEIDSSYNQDDLNQKEKFWIASYNSIEDGYNTAEGGEGGNTYKGLNKEEMGEVKEKISKSNSGRNNGMSRHLKCKSIITGEEHFFDTLGQCLEFFNIKNKAVIMTRAIGDNNTLWRHEWMFALENEEYKHFQDVNNLSRRRGTKVSLEKDGEIKIFDSKSLAMNFLGYSARQSGALLNNAIINGWKVSF